MRPTLSPNGLFFWDGSGWRSLLSADGSQLWNGEAWIPYQAPATVVPAAPAHRTRRMRPAVLGAAGAAVLLAFFAVAFLLVNTVFRSPASAHSSGADFASQPQLEQRYRDAYARDVTRLRLDSVPFAASTTGPGVCNAGGNKQGCYDADARVVGDMRSLQSHLRSLPTPTRYRTADADLQAGLTALIDGFTLRNRAISSGDPNASFSTSTSRLQTGLELLRKADTEYPADARPTPSLL